MRFGDRGTHTSRTLMVADLEHVLSAVGPGSTRAGYLAAIFEGNCLQKATTATRKLSAQRLREVYGLDPRVPLFRVLRTLWDRDEQARPQLALLAGLARDPLLRYSAGSIVSLEPGSEFQRTDLSHALEAQVGERMNDAVLAKVVRNLASSWAQSGHLKGRTFKFRQVVVARPVALVFGLCLGQVGGFLGQDLLSCGWVRVLDCSPATARSLAVEATRLGLIALREVGSALDFGLERWVEQGAGA